MIDHVWGDSRWFIVDSSRFRVSLQILRCSLSSKGMKGGCPGPRLLQLMHLFCLHFLSPRSLMSDLLCKRPTKGAKAKVFPDMFLAQSVLLANAADCFPIITRPWVGARNPSLSSPKNGQNEKLKLDGWGQSSPESMGWDSVILTLPSFEQTQKWKKHVQAGTFILLANEFGEWKQASPKPTF